MSPLEKISVQFFCEGISDDLDPLIERIETLTGLVKENVEAARIAKGFANEKLEEA